MDPAEALTDLKQISTQVERAVVVRNDGTLEASTLRDDARMVCAVTAGDPTVGLIFYDLKTCLRNIAEEPVEAVAEVRPEPVAAEPPVPAAEEEPDGQG